MFRYVVLLLIGLYLTWLIAGDDPGKMRPGLARAIAEGKEIVEVTGWPGAPGSLARSERGAEAAPSPARWRPLPSAPAAAARNVVPTSLPAEEASAVAPATGVDLITGRASARSGSIVGLHGDTARLAPPPGASGEAEAIPASEMPDVAYVTAQSANVRRTPSTRGAVVGRVQRGDMVVYLEGGSGRWAHVSIGEGAVTGYIHKSLLDR